MPHPDHADNLDMNIHILFDDTSLLPDPLSGVGWYIYADEVEPLRLLGAVLDPLIDEIGDDVDSAIWLILFGMRSFTAQASHYR